MSSLGSREAHFIYEFLLCIRFHSRLFLGRIRDFKYTLSTQDNGVSVFFGCCVRSRPGMVLRGNQLKRGGSDKGRGSYTGSGGSARLRPAAANQGKHTKPSGFCSVSSPLSAIRGACRSRNVQGGSCAAMAPA